MRGSCAPSRLFGWLFSLGFNGDDHHGIGAFLLFNHYNKDLPDYSQLENYDPPTVSDSMPPTVKCSPNTQRKKRVFVPLT